MKSHNGIQKNIGINYAILKKIDEISYRIEIFDDNKKDFLFAGFYRNALSHYYAITLLIEKELYHSSFALVRVLFENIVRAKYMYENFDENKIEELYSNSNWYNLEIFPNIRKMCHSFDKVYDNESLYEHIARVSLNTLNDYIHTGSNQIARNFTEETNTLESNFENELVISALKSIRTIITSFAIMYFNEIGVKKKYISENDIREVTKFFGSKEIA